VGAVACYFADRILTRLAAGDVSRSDGFFLPAGKDRPPSEALLEGVLLKARDEFEQKKLRHLAAFFANLIFVEDVSPEVAYVLLKQFERLTYRQLAVLSLIGGRESYDLERLQRPEHSDAEMETLKREVMDLHSNDLGTLSLLRPKDPYWTVFLSPLGRAMFELAALDEIPVQVTTELDALMAKPKGWEPPPPRLVA
jgi:hypothetical protein